MLLNPNNCGRQSLAIVLILLVDILWVSSSELTQSIFHNASYEHPYFLSYFNTSLFSLYAVFFIPLFYSTVRRRIKYNSCTIIRPNASGSNAYYQSINNKNNNNAVKAHEEPNPLNNSSFSRSSHTCCITSIPPDKLSLSATFRLSIVFCLVWFSMTYTFNLSLNLTSVASNSIISSMSGPFCLVLSRLFLRDYHLTIYNVLGVVVTVAGSSLIGYLDSFHSGRHTATFGGDLLAILSALIYAFYVTGLKYKIGDESKVNMFLFFGFIGVLNLAVLWPGIWILNMSKLELLVWPTRKIWILLFINGLLTICSDYLWAQSILLSSPVVATVGLSLMMPLAIIADEVFRGIRHSYLYYIGAVCVWLGFILVNLDMSKAEKKKSSASEAK